MPAHRTESEMALLGACMAIENAIAIPTAARHVTADDFYQPRHGVIWDACVRLHADGIPADPILVANHLEEAGTLARTGDRIYLLELYQRACPPSSVEYHAREVAEAATVRRLAVAGARIQQRADTAAVDVAELTTWAAAQIAAARNVAANVDILTRPWDVFMKETDEDRPYIIPDLLGPGDRMVLTGHGGLGKSTLLLQIAVCAAAGIPPMDWATAPAAAYYEPRRVAIIDFENPDFRVKTRAWPMVNDITRFAPDRDPRPNITFGGRGNSLNLLTKESAMSLLRTIEHDEPDLVFLGPVYKMHNDDPDREVIVKRITDVLDQIRAMGPAIITEAHHTKAGRNGGSLEPSGSNLWTWWPEYGLGLRLDDNGGGHTHRCVLERWRVDRDANRWPTAVESSGQAGLKWARADAVHGEG